MEHHPHDPEGGEQQGDERESPIYEQLTEEQRIQRGIADALNEDRPIDDHTARRIAMHLQRGEESALYVLASSGALPERLERELLESVQDLPLERDSWVDALLDYADARGEDRGTREGWREVPAEDDAPSAVAAAGAVPSTTPGAESEPASSLPEREQRSQPRIYVRCLAAYNDGILYGRWIDADQDSDAVHDEVTALLSASPVAGAEEYAIHDYEGFAGYPLGEYEDLGFVSRLARGIAQHGQAFAAYADWIGREDPELAHFDEYFEGTYSSAEVWAEEVANEVFEWPRCLAMIPQPLRSAVTLNLTDLALILGQTRHVAEGDGEVHVFNPDA